MKVHVCGIDIGKTVFHLVGLSKEGPHRHQEAFQPQAVGHLYREPADVPDWC